MSDILIVGHAPRSEKGKEFFLHSTDWWYEILHLIDDLFTEQFAVDDVFYNDHFLGPRSPHMNAEQSCTFSTLLFETIENGKARKSLDRNYREEHILVDYFEGDEERIADSLDERIEQVGEFARFLQDCGGCNAKWSWQQEGQ